MWILYSVSFYTMNQTLVIILAFFCAFHEVVDGNPIASNLNAAEPNVKDIDIKPPVAALTCFYIISLKPEIAMRTECTTTGKSTYIT